MEEQRAKVHKYMLGCLMKAARGEPQDDFSDIEINSDASKDRNRNYFSAISLSDAIYVCLLEECCSTF